MSGKIKALLIFLVVAIMLVPTGISWASGAEYVGRIQVTNSGAADTNVFSVFALKTQNLIDGAMLNETATDAAVRTGDDTIVAFMPGIFNGVDDNPWVFHVPAIGQGEQQYYFLYTGGVTDGLLCYFPGDGGMTTDYSLDLELGNHFIIEQRGWLDVNAVDSYLVKHDNAFNVYISAPGKITATITDGATVTTSAILSGECTVKIEAADDNLKIYVDDALKGIEAMGGVGVPVAPATGWTFFEGGSMVYVEYHKVWIFE